jgi:homoserine acetyltransferase
MLCSYFIRSHGLLFPACCAVYRAEPCLLCLCAFGFLPGGPNPCTFADVCSRQVNPNPGWWEEFIGPGLALDTDKYFVICCNVLGGCYGSTGPMSFLPQGSESGESVNGSGDGGGGGSGGGGGGGNTSRSGGERYAMTFPFITVSDMVRTQFRLLDSLGITTLHASVGASMGGMQSLAAAAMFPDRVNHVSATRLQTFA